jgi:hypothetical protein
MAAFLSSSLSRPCGSLRSVAPPVYDPGAGEVRIVAVPDVDLGRERRAVTQVGRDRFGGLARAVDQHDLARAAARHRGERDGAADVPGADDAEFHLCRTR